MPDYTFVYDIQQKVNRWVKTRYVQLYPNLYRPLIVRGERLYNWVW